MRWKPATPKYELKGEESLCFALFPVKLWTGEYLWLELYVARPRGPYHGGQPKHIERRAVDEAWPPCPVVGPPPKK